MRDFCDDEQQLAAEQPLLEQRGRDALPSICHTSSAPSPPAKLGRTPIRVISLRMQLYVYRENALNGEISTNSVYISVNHTNFKIF
jgi:hypothetical protein